jgi:alkanesulfonate monooxygenase SsuD/methylene tetrahydromethanopterin reductase-like flavin-dependent oxidoreductase (luciferase family)
MSTGHHEASWRLPESDPFANTDVAHFQRLAQTAERGTRREHLTVRELVGRLGGGRGHRTFSGTPEHVVGAMTEWYDAGAADGFNVMPAVLPSGLEAFVDHVVPLLVRRGLFRDEYEGTTLREHYGLGRPGNVFSTTRAVSA